MWSDPEDVDTWAISPRGAGWLFGAKVTNEVSQLHVTSHAHRSLVNILSKIAELLMLGG